MWFGVETLIVEIDAELCSSGHVVKTWRVFRENKTV